MDLKELAETIDALKIFPRIVILGYSGFGVYYISWTTNEYFKLGDPDWQESVRRGYLIALKCLMAALAP